MTYVQRVSLRCCHKPYSVVSRCRPCFLQNGQTSPSVGHYVKPDTHRYLPSVLTRTRGQKISTQGVVLMGCNSTGSTSLAVIMLPPGELHCICAADDDRRRQTLESSLDWPSYNTCRQTSKKTALQGVDYWRGGSNIRWHWPVSSIAVNCSSGAGMLLLIFLQQLLTTLFNGYTTHKMAPFHRQMSVTLNKKSKKVKASHTRYRALASELIPVYRQSARRWL